MSPVLYPSPELLPCVEGMVLRSKTERHPKYRHLLTTHVLPNIHWVTADQCDVLVSLSPNLKRFFSRIFSMDARSFELNRSRYCLKVSDPIIIFAHPVSMIPFPGLEFSIASYSPITRSRSILCFFAPTVNNAVLGVCESFPAECFLAKKHTENAIHAVGHQSQK